MPLLRKKVALGHCWTQKHFFSGALTASQMITLEAPGIHCSSTKHKLFLSLYGVLFKARQSPIANQTSSSQHPRSASLTCKPQSRSKNSFPWPASAKSARRAQLRLHFSPLFFFWFRPEAKFPHAASSLRLQPARRPRLLPVNALVQSYFPSRASSTPNNCSIRL